MLRRLLIIQLLIFTAWPAHALVDLGVGFNSGTSGRQVPAIAAGINGSGWAITGTSTGVQNDYYYYSNYSLSYFWTWSAGQILWGNASAGFGVGTFYNEHAFKDEGSSTEEDQSDFGLGPAFYTRWNVLGPVYLNMEVIFGLRDILRHVTLNGQDVVTFSVGVRL